MRAGECRDKGEGPRSLSSQCHLRTGQVTGSTASRLCRCRRAAHPGRHRPTAGALGTRGALSHPAPTPHRRLLTDGACSVVTVTHSAPSPPTEPLPSPLTLDAWPPPWVPRCGDGRWRLPMCPAQAGCEAHEQWTDMERAPLCALW